MYTAARRGTILDMESRAEEAQLVELLKLGDEAAVDHWYERYEPALKQFMLSKVPAVFDAEELTQQTFLQCLKSLSLFRGTASLQTWMLSVARHEVADFYRKLYAKKALQTLPLTQWFLSEPIPDSQEVSQKVLSVLAEMSAASKELLLKKYVDGQKVAEIAAELETTVKSVESQLFRARNEFKLLYEERA